MSIKAMNWVWDLRVGLSPAEKLILMELADHADAEHKCFPSHKLTAERTEVSVATVKRCLRKLEAMGLVRKEKRKRANGSQTSNGYILNVGGQIDPPVVDDPPARVTGEPPLTTITNHHICYDDPAGSSPDPCATTGQAPSRNSPAPKRDKWGILESDRRPVRDAIMAAARQEYRTDAYWDAFQVFRTRLSEVYGEDLAGYVDNKVSIHESAATPKGAGTKLNTIIATAIRQDNVPAPVPAR